MHRRDRGLTDRALLILLAAIVALGSVATNLYLPALPAVREYFGASVAEVQATFSVSLVTFAIGILVWGPISDRYGRRAAVLAGMAVMAIGAVVGMTAQDLGWLVAGRGLQAFGNATGIAVGRAIISDRFPPERMARALANLALVSVLANSLAPIVGGYLAVGLGWRAVFGALLVVMTVPAYFAWAHLPETRDLAGHPPHGREMLTVAGRLLRNPGYLSCTLQSSMAYAAFLVFVSLVPYVMITALGRSATEYGYYYLFVAVGYALGNWSVGRFASRHDPHWMIVVGVCVQLVSIVAALAPMAVGLKHPLWMFVPIGVMFYGQGLAMPNMSAVAVSQAPQHAGVGSSTIGFVQQIIGAACVQWMGVHSTSTAVPMLAFCTAACVVQAAVLWLSPRLEAGRGHPRAA